MRIKYKHTSVCVITFKVKEIQVDIMNQFSVEKMRSLFITY